MKLGLLETTKRHKRYWETRPIDVDKFVKMPEHPHRRLITDILKDFSFHSLLEVGCGTGANLLMIKTVFPRADIGGIDLRKELIDCAQKLLPQSSILQVGDARDIYLSTRGTDMLLSDMCYIYLGKKDFRRALQEAKRVSRVGVVLCEFHHKNRWRRFWLKCITGYNSHDYGEELRRAGFHDIVLRKLTEEDWPGGEPQRTFGYLISARS